MTNRADKTVSGRVQIPADVDRPDKLLAGLTARQLCLLAIPAVTIWLAYTTTRGRLPLPAFAAITAPVAITAIVVAVGRRDGMALDRLAAAAVRQTVHARRMVPAPDGVQPPPSWAGPDPVSSPAPLRLPALEVRTDGTVDLGSDGAARICAASAIGFSLRTPAEQHGLVAGFARYLNSLAAPIQILIRSQPVNLEDRIAKLRHAAGGLPHKALEASAQAHADFLAELTATRDLLARQTLLVLRVPTMRIPASATPHDGETSGVDAAGRLARLAADTTAALAAAGITVTALDNEAALRCLHAATDPWAPTLVGTCPTGTAVTAPGLWDNQPIGEAE